jgi:hypothetical protein
MDSNGIFKIVALTIVALNILSCKPNDGKPSLIARQSEGVDTIALNNTNKELDEKAKFDRCIAEVSSRNAESDAIRDFKLKEMRYFSYLSEGVVYGEYYPGIDQRDQPVDVRPMRYPSIGMLGSADMAGSASAQQCRELESSYMSLYNYKKKLLSRLNK